MVSVLHKEVEYKAKSSSTRSWRSCSRGEEGGLLFNKVSLARNGGGGLFERGGAK